MKKEIKEKLNTMHKNVELQIKRVNELLDKIIVNNEDDIEINTETKSKETNHSFSNNK